MHLIRSPTPAEAPHCIELADASFNADIGVIRALSAEARRQGRRHAVLPMVDLGTGRGAWAIG